MRAIQTRYLGPTNTKGSRIRAFFTDTPRDMTATVGYQSDLSSGENHLAAAKELAIRGGLSIQSYAVGEIPRGRVFVPISETAGRPDLVRF